MFYSWFYCKIKFYSFNKNYIKLVEGSHKTIIVIFHPKRKYKNFLQKENEAYFWTVYFFVL